MKRIFPIFIALLSLAVGGCETTGQNTMLGAGIGAAVAAAGGHSPLRGAAIGAGSGFVLGKLLKHEREHAYDEGYYEGHGYPRGQFSDEPGFVISPYRPHHLIDVRGIPHGARVMDPSCEQVFINP